MDPKIQLIAMDLDGTALCNDHITMAPGILEALDRVWEKGISVIPVTGRPYGYLPPDLNRPRDWLTYGIFCNGGQVRDLRTGEILLAHYFSRAMLESLTELSLEYEIPVEFMSQGRLYLTQESWDREKQDPRTEFHCTHVLQERGEAVASLQALWDCPVEKVNVNSVPKALQAPVNALCGNLALHCAWDRDCGEITHPEATKGKSLQWLCRRLDIPMDGVLALGDSENDLSMLRSAGLGIAMGNATQAVQAAARAVTLSNEQGGAAKALHRYILDL